MPPRHAGTALSRDLSVLRHREPRDGFGGRQRVQRPFPSDDKRAGTRVNPHGLHALGPETCLKDGGCEIRRRKLTIDYSGGGDSFIHSAVLSAPGDNLGTLKSL